MFKGMAKIVFEFVESKFKNKMQDKMDDIMLQNKKMELISKIKDINKYAKKADESYRHLIYNNLNRVPAVDKYDGDYSDRLFSLEMSIETETKIEKLEMFDSRIKQTATEIQTYLNEETSDLEAAKLWDSKFIKGVSLHIPPHYEGSKYSQDEIMSEVMRAFRNWSSFAQATIDMYGSQRLINATYEAVEDGQDAMAYMSEILDLNQRSSGFGGGLHERVIVPHAGFFGSGFFF